jgi:predicted ribosome quality control (RQC) complex YloA/Tae2 family protein
VKDIRDNVMGKRLANVYDLSERTYLFKFTGLSSSEKCLLLIESGIRFHCTQYVRSTPDLPSPFAMKLRRHIRTKRLENIQQLGYDRVVDMKFGSGESIHHLILEFYAGGNIVLTDGNYEVLALLRSHQFSDDVALNVGEIYPVAYSTNITKDFGKYMANSADASAGVTAASETSNLLETDSSKAFLDWIASKKESTAISNEASGGNGGGKKEKKSSSNFTLKQLLLNKESGYSHLGPEIIEHCILVAGLKQNTKLSQILQLEISQITSLLSSLNEGITVLDSLDSLTAKGFIILEKNGSGNYVEYTPILLNQHQLLPNHEFGSFSEAVDEYYYKIEDQKMNKEIQSKEDAAKKKISKVQEDQERIVASLSEQKKRFEGGGMLLEIHSEEVDKVRMILNSWIDNEFSWKAIEDMVEDHKSKGRNDIYFACDLLMFSFSFQEIQLHK